MSNTDSRLNAALRVAINDYSRRVRVDLAETASSLAHATSVQQAFQTRNRAALVRLARSVPDAAFYINDQLVAGRGSGGPPCRALVVGLQRGRRADRPHRRLVPARSHAARPAPNRGRTDAPRPSPARAERQGAHGSRRRRRDEHLAAAGAQVRRTSATRRYRAVSAPILETNPPLTLVVVDAEGDDRRRGLRAPRALPPLLLPRPCDRRHPRVASWPHDRALAS